LKKSSLRAILQTSGQCGQRLGRVLPLLHAQTTAVGTGAGSVGILHGETMVDELKLFIKAG
jgi:hypothetical protein